MVHDGSLFLGMRILIDEMPIKRIIALPHHGKDPVDGFVGKNKDKEMIQMMKDKFGLVNKSHGCQINSIEDQDVCFATNVLVGKIMRKCMATEVTVVVVSLATQCEKGIQFN